MIFAGVVANTVDVMIKPWVVEGAVNGKLEDAAVDSDIDDEAVTVAFEVAASVNLDDKSVAVLYEAAPVIRKALPVVELRPTSPAGNPGVSARRLPPSSSIDTKHVADWLGSRCPMLTLKSSIAPRTQDVVSHLGCSWKALCTGQ